MEEKKYEAKRARLERSVASSSLHSSLESENLDEAMIELPEFDFEDEIKENIPSPMIHQKPAPKYTKWDPDMSVIPCIPSDGAPSRLLESCGEEPVSLALCGRGFCDDDFLLEARAASTSTNSSTSSRSRDSSTSSQSTDSSVSCHSYNYPSMTSQYTIDQTNSLMSTDTTQSDYPSHHHLTRTSHDLSKDSRESFDLTRDSHESFDLTRDSRDSFDLTSISNMNDQSSHHIAVQQLLQCEAMYVEEMHKAIETYSRPLRYCVLSTKDHVKLFQNVEKVRIKLTLTTLTTLTTILYKPF